MGGQKCKPQAYNTGDECSFANKYCCLVFYALNNITTSRAPLLVLHEHRRGGCPCVDVHTMCDSVPTCVFKPDLLTGVMRPLKLQLGVCGRLSV